MGVDTVMASTIIFYALLVAASFLAGLTLTALTGLSQAYSTSANTLSVDLIDFRGLNYTNASTYPEVWINLTNVGPNNIYDYNDTDVIVTYVDYSGVLRVYLARFKGSYLDALQSGLQPGWYINAFYDATGQATLYRNSSPELWKPNTTMEVVIVLPGPVKAGSKVSVTVATPRGGREYVEFTWS